MLKLTIVLPLIFVLIFAAVGCNQAEDDELLPVAVVNGVEVSREDFDREVAYYVDMYTNQGYQLTQEDMELIKEMALEQVINTQLLLQAAEQAGISAQSIDAKGEFDYTRSLFDSEEEFDQALAEQGLTRESFMELLTESLMIHELLSSQLDFDSIEVTDEEVQELFSLLEAEHGELDFEEVEPYLISQLQEEKEDELINSYIQQLREEASIEILGY